MELYYLIAIIVTVVLISNDRKKKKTGQIATPASAPVANAGEPNADAVPAQPVAPPPPPKPKNPATTLNVMLYIGSFLIVSAVMAFIGNADDNLIAPTVIALTMLFYLTGLGLYKTVSYLKPVATSFVVTALIIFPFWFFAFLSMDIGAHASYILSSMSTMLALAITTFVMNSKTAGCFLYPAIIFFGWSLIPENADKGAMYALYLIPAFFSFIPQLMWLMRISWLPIALRKATQVYGIILMPIVAFFALWTFLVPNMATEFPFFRFFIFGLLLVYTFLKWYDDHKDGSMILLRLATQVFLWAALCDAFQYSLFDSFASNADAAKCTIMAVVWALSFLVQNLLSLFARHEEKEVISAERFVQIGSMVAIIATPLLCNYMDAETQSIVRIILYLIIGALGIVYSMFYKNVSWSVATFAAIILIPLQIGGVLCKPAWDGWGYLICYAVVSAIIIGVYAYLRRIQEKPALVITLIGLAACSVIMISAGSEVGYTSIGWVCSALTMAVTGLLSGETSLYEVAIWESSFCLFSVVGEIYSTALNPRARTYGFYSGLEDPTGLVVARTHALALAPIITCIWRERTQKTFRVRLLIAYAILTLGMYSVAVWAHFGMTDATIFTIIFLFEQLSFLVLGSLIHTKWLLIAGAAGVVIGAFHITSGLSYLWLGIAGVALITFVIWQFTKNHSLAESDDKTLPPAEPKAE